MGSEFFLVVMISSYFVILLMGGFMFGDERESFLFSDVGLWRLFSYNFDFF